MGCDTETERGYLIARGGSFAGVYGDKIKDFVSPILRGRTVDFEPHVAHI